MAMICKYHDHADNFRLCLKYIFYDILSIKFMHPILTRYLSNDELLFNNEVVPGMTGYGASPIYHTGQCMLGLVASAESATHSAPLRPAGMILS